jgi:hypothetical protein
MQETLSACSRAPFKDGATMESRTVMMATTTSISTRENARRALSSSRVMGVFPTAGKEDGG